VEQKIKKYFSDGLNSDLAEHLVAPTSYISGHDLRIGSTDNGGVGYVENILKNAEKAHSLPAGVNTRVGFCADDENGFIVKANQNSNGDDGIYLYDINTGTWYTVLLSDDVTGGLGFNKYNLMNGMYIIDKMLFFNDGTEDGQRVINISAFMDAYGSSPFASADYTITLPIDETEITLIKKPHCYPPSAQKLYDAGFNNNFIQNTSFQSAIQYIYYDGQTAVLSGWSKASLLNTSTENYNYIQIKADITESVTQTVRLVRFSKREQGKNGGYAAKTYDRENSTENTDIDNQNIIFDFYGNVSGEFLDNATLVKQQDEVPLISGTMERAKNTTILGDNTKGYDTPTETSLELSLPSAISMGFTSLTKNLIDLRHKNSRVGSESYAYVGWYVYLTEIAPVGYYAITSTEILNTSSGTYPTLGAAPGTVAFSGLAFRGATLAAVALATAEAGTWRYDGPYITTSVSTISITGFSGNTYSVYLPQSQYKAGELNCPGLKGTRPPNDCAGLIFDCPAICLLTHGAFEIL